ncbi:MAG: ABC transporter ATP-binding protein, partial [Treponema sp.]|nr:ABC transporter ATP-binding protein [Treponema sp.]
FGIDTDESKKRALVLLEQLELLDAKDQKLSEYSTGMRQRLSFARAMIHHPPVLFLDEPTSGLDPENAQSVNNIIKNLAKEKKTTVFLCTHQLRYAEEICSVYGLLSEGVMLACGTLEELRSHVFTGLTAVIKADKYPPGLDMRREGDYALVDVETEEEIPVLVRRINESGGKLYHVSARRHSLEEIYFTLIEKRRKDGTAI